MNCEGCPESVVLFDKDKYYGSVPDKKSRCCDMCKKEHNIESKRDNID